MKDKKKRCTHGYKNPKCCMRCLTKEAELHIGDLVRSNDGQSGTVIHSGPYGDSPFQVKTSPFTVWPYIEADGTCQYSKRVWEVIKK